MDSTLETLILIRTKWTVITTDTPTRIVPLIQILTDEIEPFHKITASAMILVKYHTADRIGEHVIILRVLSLVIIEMFLTTPGARQVNQIEQNIQIIFQ